MVAGGDVAPVPDLARVLPPHAFVIAADSGVRHARTLGLTIDVAIGDFDSATASEVDYAAALGATVLRYPVAKDKTDLELALDHACSVAGTGARVVVIASASGRLDHAMANVLLLVSSAYADVVIDAYVDDWLISVVRNERRALHARRGALVSLLVIDAPAVRVTTTGLEYPLRDELVYQSSTRGVSNVAIDGQFEVQADGGALLAMREWAD